MTPAARPDPLRRFERYFNALANGEGPGRLLCAPIDRSTSRLRAEWEAPTGAPAEPQLPLVSPRWQTARR